MCFIAKLKKNINIITPEGRAVEALTRKAGFCGKMKTHNFTLSIKEQLKYVQWLLWRVLYGLEAFIFNWKVVEFSLSTSSYLNKH